MVQANDGRQFTPDEAADSFYNTIIQRGEPPAVAQAAAETVRSAMESGVNLDMATSMGMSAVDIEKKRRNIPTSVFNGGPSLPAVAIAEHKQKQQMMRKRRKKK